MGVPEQTACAFLSFTAQSGDATALLGRSLAAYTTGAVERAEQVTDVLRTLGRQFVDRAEAGAWIATAAHRAGITLPAASDPRRCRLPPGRDVQALRRGKALTGVQGQSRNRGVQETHCRAKRKRLGGGTVSLLLDWRRFRAVRLRHLFVVH
jgi:hypothetical protein